MSNERLSYSLAWREHLKTFCAGLSNLQQNEEFVDMTLAADGHFVKVHKIILALASPYIKDVISSMECHKPVLFLHGVSFTTLCSILEYIYTGEVLVKTNNINDFLDAAKSLKIRGLSEVHLDESMNIKSNHYQSYNNDTVTDTELTEDTQRDDIKVREDYVFDDQHSEQCVDVVVQVEPFCRLDSRLLQDDDTIKTDVGNIMQYTMSNQGSLQLILNNYVYYLKYTNKDSSQQWRCVDYLNKWKCRAALFTKDDIAVVTLPPKP
ncbi:unnamed protein product [Leptidea sinapis]|uniref:BTB domain-containing protein n=1 Tax=Leptidea sinapis TaxID=189913 RepID=A0A5E4Q0Y4_9NEOP|nr:unnamed protein product [Leptidea sinapis]